MWMTSGVLTRKIKEERMIRQESLCLLNEKNQQSLEGIEAKLADIENQIQAYRSEQSTFHREWGEQFSQLSQKLLEIQNAIGSQEKGSIMESLGTIQTNIDSARNDSDEGIHAILEAAGEIGNDMSQLFASVLEREDLAANHAAVMNQSLQGILQNIMALDEGNRLIIANMLLQDMGD